MEIEVAKNMINLGSKQSSFHPKSVGYFTWSTLMCYIYRDFFISVLFASVKGVPDIPSRGRHEVETAQNMQEVAVGNQAWALKTLPVLNEPKGSLGFCLDQQHVISSGFISFTGV